MTSAAMQISKSAPLGRRQARRGFSFVEVLFSVIILGIGFIMVAAIFPVSIAQSKSSTEETFGTDVARGASAVAIRAFQGGDFITANPLLPATGVAGGAAPHPGRILPIPENARKRLQGNLVNPADPRFAYVMTYRRDGDPDKRETWSPFAQVFVVAVESRLKSTFDYSAFAPVSAAPAVGANADITTNLEPRSVAVTIFNGDEAAGETDTIEIGDLDATDTAINAVYKTPSAPNTSPFGTPADVKVYCMPRATEAVTTGTYVIIGNDTDVYSGNPPRNIAGNTGRMVGRIYRIGNYVGDRPNAKGKTVSVWELAPGGDFSPDAGANSVLQFDPAATPTPTAADTDDIYQPSTTPVADRNTWQAWIVGKSFNGNWRPVVGTDGYEGTAMDVGAFTTFVKMN